MLAPTNVSYLSLPRTRDAEFFNLAVKLIFSFLLSYPLAGLLKRVPDARPAYKNLFSLGYVAETGI